MEAPGSRQKSTGKSHLAARSPGWSLQPAVLALCPPGQLQGAVCGALTRCDLQQSSVPRRRPEEQGFAAPVRSSGLVSRLPSFVCP